MPLPIIVWENVVEDPGLVFFTATDTDSGSQYDINNTRDYRPYTRWKAASSGDKYLTGDWTGTNVTVDAWAIIGHNLATVGADVALEVYEGAWVDAGSGIINPSQDNEIILGLLPTTKVDNAFRLALTGCSAAPEVGVFILGQKLEFPRYLEGAWDPYGLTVQAEQSISQTGEILGSTIRYREHNLTAQWTRLTNTWIRNTFLPVWDAHLALLKPFVFAWNPGGAALDELRYVSLLPNAQLQAPYDPNRQSLTLSMRGPARP